MKLFLLIKTFVVLFAITSVFTACTTSKNSAQTQQFLSESQQDAKTNFEELKYLFENRKYNSAYNLLDDMKARLPYSRYTKHGKILAIHSYYERNKFQLVIDEVDNFLITHPLHEQQEYLFYLQALASFELNKFLYQNLSLIPKVIDINRTKIRQTFLYFSTLAKKNPKGNYFKESVKKVMKLRQVLAKYELNDAQLLFDKKQYEMVIDRIDYLIQNYSRSPSILKGLQLQAKAYRILGQVDIAISIEANIKRNYEN